MAGLIGMDAADIRLLAGRLWAQADGVGQAVSAVDGIVQQIGHSWSGPAATEFIGWWQRQHRPRLLEARDALAGLAQSADNNAAQQEQASSASGEGRLAAGRAVSVASVGALARSLGGRSSSGSYTRGGLTAQYASSTTFSDGASRTGSVRLGPTSAVLTGAVIGSYGLTGTVRANEKWGPVTGKGQASGFAGASGAAQGSLRFSPTGVRASGQAEGRAGVFGSASQSLSAGGVTSVTAGSAMVGAVAAARGSATLGPGRMSETASGGAFAGASASGSETLQAGGVGATATGDVYAGVGAHFSESASLSATDVTVKIDVGAALGVGAGGAVAWHVDPAEVAHGIETHLPFGGPHPWL